MWPSDADVCWRSALASYLAAPPSLPPFPIMPQGASAGLAPIRQRLHMLTCDPAPLRLLRVFVLKCEKTLDEQLGSRRPAPRRRLFPIRPCSDLWLSLGASLCAYATQERDIPPTPLWIVWNSVQLDPRVNRSECGAQRSKVELNATSSNVFFRIKKVH